MLSCDDWRAVLERAKAWGLHLESPLDPLLETRPSLESLLMVKDFFKGLIKSTARNSAEHEAAQVCYYLSIGAARLRLHQRITGLKDSQLLKGITWALKRKWIDRHTRGLLEESATAFGSPDVS